MLRPVFVSLHKMSVVYFIKDKANNIALYSLVAKRLSP